jgi:hypothetical protein
MGNKASPNSTPNKAPDDSAATAAFPTTAARDLLSEFQSASSSSTAMLIDDHGLSPPVSFDLRSGPPRRRLRSLEPRTNLSDAMLIEDHGLSPPVSFRLTSSNGADSEPSSSAAQVRLF